MADLQPHLQVSLTRPGAASTCGAGQTHLEPTSPFCLSQPPDPLRVSVLPACALGLPPHPWSGLCVLFGSWKEADSILQKEGLDDRQRGEGRWERKRANVLAFIKSRNLFPEVMTQEVDSATAVEL